MLAILGGAAPVHGRAASDAVVESGGPADATARAAVVGERLVRGATRVEALGELADLVELEEQALPGAIAPWLERVARGSRAHPLVRAQAAIRLAALDDEEGRADRAAAGWRELGFVTAARVLGPFEAQGRDAIDQEDLPIAAPPDPFSTVEVRGKARDVAWKRIDVFRRGALVLDAVLRPDREASAYVLVYVEARRAGLAAVRVGAPGPVRIWHDGAEVARTTTVRPAFPDQIIAAARLRRGVNLLLLKSVNLSGAWRLFLRLTEPDGAPIAWARPVEPPRRPQIPWRPAPRPRGAAPVLDAREALEIAARSGRAGAALALAGHVHAASLSDAGGDDAEFALRRVPNWKTDPAALHLLARVAREEHVRREALELLAALPAAETWRRAGALAGLAELARQEQRSGVALGHARAAVELDAGAVSASLVLAELETEAGLGALAWQRLSRLPASSRHSPAVLRRYARLAERLQRADDARAAWRDLLAARPADQEALGALAASARARGDLSEALKLEDRAAAARPELLSLTLSSARTAEALGDVAGAAARLAAAIARSPDEPTAHEALGRLLVRQGRRAEAADALDRSLALRPQQPDLRRLRDGLRGGAGTGSASGGQDLARRFGADGFALARQVWQAGTGARPEEDARILLDRRVVHVHDNGLAETFTQWVVHLRSEEAVRRNREFAVRFVPGAQAVEFTAARVYRRAGGEVFEVLEAFGRDERDLSEPWYGLYYDQRAEVVLFDDLRPGDVIEVGAVLSDVAARNEMGDYFGELQLVGGAVAKNRWDFRAIMPPGRALYANRPKIATFAESHETVGGEVHHVYAATDVPRIIGEPGMPGLAEVAPYLHVSTYRTWDEVGRFYWRLVADQLLPDDRVRELARTATAGAGTVDEKVRALYRAVTSTTRYVGLEFGIHGYKPYKVSEVLARRFGDCKDKASLLIALLREVGVEAQLALLRTRPLGRIDPTPASLAVFDHAVAYVPALDLYLDATAEYAGARELPGADRAAMVLRVAPDRATLEETPASTVDDNWVERRWSVVLDDVGGARVRDVARVQGEMAQDWRARYQSEGERREVYEKVWAERAPGARVSGIAVEGHEDWDRPFVLRAEVEARLGDRREAEWHLPLASRVSDLIGSFARASSRRWDLVIGFPWRHRDTIEFQLPRGWRMRDAPPSRSETTPFGRLEFVVTVAPDGAAVRVASLLEVSRWRVSPEEYPALRAFFQLVDTTLRQRLVLAPAMSREAAR